MMTNKVPTFREYLEQRDPEMVEGFFTKKVLPAAALTAGAFGLGAYMNGSKSELPAPTAPSAIVQPASKVAPPTRNSKSIHDVRATYLGEKNGSHNFHVRAPSEMEAKQQAKWMYTQNLGTRDGNGTHSYTTSPTSVNAEDLGDGEWSVTIRQVRLAGGDDDEATPTPPKPTRHGKGLEDKKIFVDD